MEEAILSDAWMPVSLWASEPLGMQDFVLPTQEGHCAFPAPSIDSFTYHAHYSDAWHTLNNNTDFLLQEVPSSGTLTG